MGQLPAAQLRPSRPFHVTGLDYAGLIPVRLSKGQGIKASKGYVALFICTATRAIHLKVVSDLTSNSFLAAFARFCARRGTCSQLLSDNATTFVRAAQKLNQLFYQSSNCTHEVNDHLVQKGVSWQFIPPRAPHHGGLWESGVKSFKHHFKRVLGETTSTFEELSTLIAKSKACLNSRPLCTMREDPNRLTPLTPAHFLVGSPILLFPEPYNENDEQVSYVSRWKQFNLMQYSFWSHWTKEVLHQLQHSNKWLKQQPNLQCVDVVLLKDELAPPE